MVRPLSFGFNEETAYTNTFQNRLELDVPTTRARAIAEFDTMVIGLRHHGIQVTVFEDHDTGQKPDAVFPNNWFSSWQDGRVFLYPMATPNRRTERTPAALAALGQHFVINSVTDLSASEQYDQNLESTGVMIFDHCNKIVYGCVSPRCDAALFTQHAQQLGYKSLLFHAYGVDGTAIYHTNVLMGIESTTAVICAEAIPDEIERAAVIESLIQTGHEVVPISQHQMSAFCGNVLELTNDRGDRFLAMSQTAYDAFTPEQRAILAHDKTLLPFGIPTIESIGGGSVRCMLGEIFLPSKT